MTAVGDAFRRAGVRAIYLLHGTFIGNDALGMLSEVARFAPAVAETLRQWNKGILDRISGDFGNFPPEAGQLWEDELNVAGLPSIPVRLFNWSSENHHLGRADGAVRLLRELRQREFAPGSRVLLVGHSHGGNVLALLTNLLGAEPALREKFFLAAKAYYRFPLWGRIDQPEWEEMRQLATAHRDLLPGVHLDLVTLGTPVRYGWDTAVGENLLHIVFHRPIDGLPPYRAPFPPTASDLWHAAHGDFVQQGGIAGTNLSPPVWSWRTCDADVRLGQLLQKNIALADLVERLRCGMRAHADGENLLVDYGPQDGGPSQHLFGHAIYTRNAWRLFHLEQIATRFYALDKTSERTSPSPEP